MLNVLWSTFNYFIVVFRGSSISSSPPLKWKFYSVDNHHESLQVTTPLLFKLIPGVVHLGVLLRWFSPDSSIEVNADLNQNSRHCLTIVLLFPKAYASLNMFLTPRMALKEITFVQKVGSSVLL